ncbi:MAG: hypothetical protein IKU30_02260, partial [Clostridia bacterium]|nr:hypothetical protein [Clostridia bacterium]
MATILVNIKTKSDFSELNSQFDKLTGKAQNLSNVFNKTKTDKQVTEVNNLTKKYSDLLKTVDNIKKKYPEGVFDGVTGEIKGNLDVMKQYFDTLKKGGQITAEDAKKINELTVKYSECATKVSLLKTETQQLESAVIKSDDSITTMIGKFFEWQIAATIVMQSINLVRNALSSMNETLVETEDKVIAIKRVINESIGNQQIADQLYDIAIAYGQTFENVSDI